MGFQLHEFSPAQVVLKIDTKSIDLSFMTLAINTKIHDEYGSVADVFKSLDADPPKIIDVIWLLVLDKNQFGESIEGFKKFVFSSRQPTGEWAKEMTRCLYDIITKSSPVIKNAKRYEEMQEIKGGLDKKEICYATYYDSIAMRYGYDIPTFYNLTLRQLQIMLMTIRDETHSELEIQAALNGRELKSRIKFEDITEEQEADNESQALDALAQLQKEYEEKKDK